MDVASSPLCSIPRSNPLIICRCFTLGLTACSRGNPSGLCHRMGCRVGREGSAECTGAAPQYGLLWGWGLRGGQGSLGEHPQLGRDSHTARFGHLRPQFGRWERLLPGLCTSCVPPSSLPSCRHALGTWNNPFCSPRTPRKVQLQDHKNFS